jgi:glycosyltransferase involved in cell wall biosynthesis
VNRTRSDETPPSTVGDDEAAALASTAHVDRPRKVLFVFGSLERAGAQLRTLEVCRALRTRDALDFEFCSIDLGPTEIEEDVERLGGRVHVVSIRSPRFLRDFPRLLRAGRYDVVNTEPQFLSGLVVWLAARQRVPVRIVTIHNTIGDRGQSARKPIVRLVLSSRPFLWAMRTMIKRHATDVLAVSQSALDSVLPSPREAPGKVAVLYNGTDLGPFEGPSDAVGVRTEFGWPADSRIVVNVGRLSTQKNHRAILEATRLAHEEDESLRLLLVGSGQLRDEIDGLIAHLGLRNVCALTSNRPDVPRLLIASDVFFFPSSWEGLPGAPLEALAAGLPVVASDIPSMREIAPFFPGAILMAPPDDIRAHAEHLLAAVRMPRDRSRARELFATTPFALANAVEAYRSIYALDGTGRSDA